MDDNKDLASAHRYQNAAKAAGLAGVAADTADAEHAASETRSAQLGDDGSMPPLKRISLILADLIEAQLTVNAGPQANLVPGTNFTEQGVQVLLRELGKRSETPGAPGRFLSWWLLTFLTRSGKAEETFIAGANLMRLQRLATVLDRIRSQRPAPSTSAPAAADGEDAEDAMELVVERDDAFETAEAIEVPQNLVETPLEQPAKQPHSKPARRHRKKQAPAPKEEPET